MPATSITAVSISHRHIIISFLTGDDGGFSQTITCQFRTGNDGAFINTDSRQFEVGYFGREELVVAEDLEPITNYSVRLKSDSDCSEGSVRVSNVTTLTTKGKMIKYVPLKRA